MARFFANELRNTASEKTNPPRSMVREAPILFTRVAPRGMLRHCARSERGITMSESGGTPGLNLPSKNLRWKGE